MTSPSTSRDRVETGAQASGGNDVVNAGSEASKDSTEEAAAALKRAELIKQAETNMMEVANRARDESNPPTGEDIKKALDLFHAAADASPWPASHAADDRGSQLPPGTAVAGSKRPSDTVARRVTREDVSAPPAERHRDDDAATMDVDDDDAFAGEQPVGNKFPTPKKFSRLVATGAEPRPARRVFLPRTRTSCASGFPHSAATRDVYDRADRARVFVNRANGRASASRRSLTAQLREMSATARERAVFS